MIETFWKCRLKMHTEVCISREFTAAFSDWAVIAWHSAAPCHEFRTSEVGWTQAMQVFGRFSALWEVKQHIVLGQINPSVSWNEWSLIQPRPRSGDFLCWGNNSSILSPAGQAWLLFTGNSTHKSTLAFNFKSSLLIIFIPLELVTITFPSAARLWVMNVALPNRQAGTRLPVRMPDVTKKYHKHGCPLAFVSVGRIHSSSNYESSDLIPQCLS